MHKKRKGRPSTWVTGRTKEQTAAIRVPSELKEFFYRLVHDVDAKSVSESQIEFLERFKHKHDQLTINN